MILVIFDIDGTLVYSDRLDSRCFAETYEQTYGRIFPTIDWSRYPHVTDTTIFETVIREHFDRPVIDDEVADFQARFVERIRELRRVTPQAFREVPGARSAVERLSENGGFVVGVATGGWQQPARVKLDHVGISVLDTLFLGADGFSRREEIIGAVIQRAKARFPALDKVVYIGDALWDVRTTRNMALAFVGIRLGGDHEVLLQAGATRVLTDYRDFEAFSRAIREAQPPAEKGAAPNTPE